MTSDKRLRRLVFENKIMEREMPHFQCYNLMSDTYIQGWHRTRHLSLQLQLTLYLPDQYPYEKPNLYLTSPITLWGFGHSYTINAEEMSHTFHTGLNGPNGCVQICHTGYWTSSNTIVGVLIKGFLWCEAYDIHLRTGKTIAQVFEGNLF